MTIKKEKWKVELEAGNMWRAKEILRSMIRYTYDTDIYLTYGKILYDVHDYYEAGKYLFIAGEAMDGEYKDAIDIFIKRNQCSDNYQFISNFPRKFVQEPFKNYPISVQNYLNERGFKKKAFDEFKINNEYVQKELSLFYKVLGIIFLSFAIISLIIGGKTIIEWLLNI